MSTPLPGSTTRCVWVTTVVDQFMPPALTAAAARATAANDNPREADIVSAAFWRRPPRRAARHPVRVEVPTIHLAREADALGGGAHRRRLGVHQDRTRPGSAARKLPTLDAATIGATDRMQRNKGASKLAVVHAHNIPMPRLGRGGGGRRARPPVPRRNPRFRIDRGDRRPGCSSPDLCHPRKRRRARRQRRASITRLSQACCRAMRIRLRRTFGGERIATIGRSSMANIAALHAGVPIWRAMRQSRHLDGHLAPSRARIAGRCRVTPCRRSRRQLPCRPTPIGSGHGRIAPALPRLLLVDGDPTRDITADRAIVEVWKDGRRQHLCGMHAAADRHSCRLDRERKPLTLPADGLIARFAPEGAGSRSGAVRKRGARDRCDHWRQVDRGHRPWPGRRVGC